MTKTVFALLVGIDHYHPGTAVADLRGCKRDITAFHTYLEGRVAKEKHRYEPILLTDAQATRQAVIDHFRTHLGQARKGDQAIFYFSGHGGRAKVPQELSHLEPDGLMETFVCHDSRVETGTDLVDKELRFLIYELSQKEPEITIILDCCHSGTGTRSTEIGIRQALDDERDRNLETFLFMENKTAWSEIATSDSAETGKLQLPTGEHILLAACQANQFAKEKPIDNVPSGVFSYYLLDSLKVAGHTLTYRDLFMRVNALVKANVSNQTPQLETPNSAILERPFLGGAIQPNPDHFTVSFDKKLDDWVVDAGEIHGIGQPRKGETTHFALYPFDAAANDLRDLSKSEKSVAITNVLSTRSQITHPDLDDTTTYKAVITALPIDPLLVRFTGDEKAIGNVRDAMARSAPGGEASFLVQEVDKDEPPTLVFNASAEQYQIRRVGDIEPLVVGTQYGEDAAETAVDRLEHIARWHNLLNLKQPANSLNTNAIQLRIQVKDARGNWIPDDQEIVLSYRSSGRFEDWEKPEMKMSLFNASTQRLFCMLLDLTEKFKIFSLTENDGQWLEPGEEFAINEGRAFQMSVPDDFWQQGRTSFRDTVKLIVTTEASYALRLQQSDLPTTINKARSTPPDLLQIDTLSRLMHRSKTRAVVKKKPKKVSRWYALEKTFTTIRPKEATLVKDSFIG